MQAELQLPSMRRQRFTCSVAYRTVQHLPFPPLADLLKTSAQRVGQALERAAERSEWRDDDPLIGVAAQAGDDAGPQQRGLAAPGGAEDQQESGATKGTLLTERIQRVANFVFA